MNSPRPGDRITYKGHETGTVIRTEGNLCWMSFDSGADSAPFIWRFKDGLNTLHDWPGKHDR